METIKSAQQYIDNAPDDKREGLRKLHEIFRDNLPPGFEEGIGYGMISYSVPKATYPQGYHCNPKLPLPFINLAAQKNFIAVYHMGLYSDPELYEWFVAEYPKHSKTKLDMGKSCIRFKKPDAIPFDLMAQLAQKVTVEDWINQYERALRR